MRPPLLSNSQACSPTFSCSLRYIIWPSVFWRMLSHSQQSLFLGTFPMGFATIVNMVVFACVPSFGHK
jgi:hypothetical protein